MAGLEARPIGARFTGRRQHDEWWRPVDSQLPGDVKALDVGQADIEQDEIRANRPSSRQARGAVVGLADDDEAVGFEDGPGLDPEPGMVIDDEDGVHGAIVPWPAPSSYRASPDLRGPRRRRPARP